MGNPLFARKPLSMLLSESKETGEHSLKRTLGPFQLTRWALAPSSAPAFSCSPASGPTMPGPA